VPEMQKKLVVNIKPKPELAVENRNLKFPFE
jgi:hypothetical protein